MPEQTVTGELEPARYTLNHLTGVLKEWNEDGSVRREYHPESLTNGEARPLFERLALAEQMSIVKVAHREQTHRELATWNREFAREAETAPAPVVTLRRTAPRTRGAGRPAARRAAGARSGSDPGEDGESSEPPPAGRLCLCGCGASLAHLRAHARYLNDTHRKRAQRDRDRANPERVVERELARRDPLRPRWCGCCTEAGSYDLDGDPVCCHCGLRRRDARREVGIGFDFAERDRQMRSNGQPALRPRLKRDWRTRPGRSLATKLRKTRNPETVAVKRKRAA